MTQKNIYSIWEKIAEDKPAREAIVHWSATEAPVRWTYRELLEKAAYYSILLKRYGIKKGQVCALILRHNPMFYPLYIGLVGIGAIPAVLAYPNPRLHPEKFRQGLKGMSQKSGLDWICSERELEPVIAPFFQRRPIKGIFYINDLEFPPGLTQESILRLKKIRSKIFSSDPLLLQHSSGTTGLQKPVLLTHKAVMEHVINYTQSLKLGEEDKVVSWLPLYHDMGLIAAFHLPLASGITSIQIDPFQWVVAPIILLEAITREKATLAWMPNFTYNFMANSIRDDELRGINLKCMRMIINCSEPIRHESHQKFLKKFSGCGLEKGTLASSYAMAETAFAVTQSKPGKEPEKFIIDKDSLSLGKLKFVRNGMRSRVCVSSGNLIPGCKIKIVDGKRRELPRGKIGEIAVQSDSLFTGYRNYPKKTKEVLQCSWYFSGDLGFIHKGEVCVIGRKKDLIIVAGKNIYPEDIEDAVGNIAGVIPGRVIAFGEDDAALGTEAVSVIAETKVSDKHKNEALSVKIKEVTANQCDVTVKKVYLVPPRWLIKSSSGKQSRSANKARILSKEH